jgi:hypothetical protein
MAKAPKDPTSSLSALVPPEESEERAALRRLAMRDPLEGNPMLLPLGPGPNPQMVEVAPGGWKKMGLGDPKTGLPPRCPVVPLGKNGEAAYFLDTLGEIVRIPGQNSGKGLFDLLFAGRGGWMTWAWPRWTKATKREPSKVNGWAADEARIDLFHACWLRGIYDESGIVRGLGAWRGDDDGFIYHAGDAVLVNGSWREPGEYGAAIYPARRAITRPWPKPEPAGIGSAGDYFLELLRSFNWQRGELDARLALGWMMTAKMGGALDRRPVALVTGGEGSGKSTLQELMRGVMIGALIKSSNTTQAGIYQLLKQDSIAVLIDEMEAKDDTRTTDRILELARICYSGDTAQRGGKDGTGMEFTLRSSFLGSCITKPATTAQDDSRMVHLLLRERTAAGERLATTAPEVHEMGRKLLRRVVDGWPRWAALLAAFRTAMIETGHDDRACDTFGTLAAASHLAISDEMPAPHELAQWIAWLDRRNFAEIAEQRKTWQRLLDHLLNARPEALRTSAHKSAGEAIAAFKREGAVEIVNLDRALTPCGLAMSWPKGVSPTFATSRLFVPFTSAALADLFEGTVWAGRKGGQGPWGSVLRQAPAEIWSVGTCGKGMLAPARGLLIDLPAVLSMAGGQGDGE